MGAYECVVVAALDECMVLRRKVGTEEGVGRECVVAGGLERCSVGGRIAILGVVGKPTDGRAQ